MTKHLEITPTQAKAELAKRELAKRYLLDFGKYVYEGYKTSWHIELICEALEHVLAGKIRFLIIECPPRHSKSLHVSQLFPAFAVGQNKDDSIIVSSYSGELAVDHGRETRNIIKSQAYKNVFNTTLAPDSDAKGKWNTDGKGAYNAVGVGGSITGRGAKYFIVDDPLKDRQEADSEVIREARWKWLRSVARTRLTPDGAMIIMHTRWHEDDIIGRLTEVKESKEEWVDYFDYLKDGLQGAKWVRLTLKAVAEEDEEYRKKGEVLWSEQYPLVELQDIKSSLGPYEWSALYQQVPVDDESREFKKEWFKQSSFEAIQKLEHRKFATIDTALRDKTSSDYTGVTRCFVTITDDWHINGRRYRLDSRGILDLIFMLHDEGFEKIGIEEGAFLFAVKPFLDEEMKKRGVFPSIVPLKHHQTMKEVRIRGLIPRYAVGKIYHIESEDLETEALSFPRGANDDVLDSVAYLPQIVKAPRARQAMTQHAQRSRANVAL